MNHIYMLINKCYEPVFLCKVLALVALCCFGLVILSSVCKSVNTILNVIGWSGMIIILICDLCTGGFFGTIEVSDENMGKVFFTVIGSILIIFSAILYLGRRGYLC